MRTILLAGVAFALLSGAANATDKKPGAEWYTYQVTSQTCGHNLTPPQILKMIREMFHQEADTDDTTDASGKVIGTKFSFTTLAGDMEIHAFRYRADCEDYANSQRQDTSRYQ